MLIRQDRNPLSAKNEFGIPRLQSDRNLTAILDPLFGSFTGRCPITYALFICAIFCDEDGRQPPGQNLIKSNFVSVTLRETTGALLKCHAVYCSL